METSRIVVVGSGMAGLLACHAVADVTGTPCTVLSDHLPQPVPRGTVAGVHVLHDRCSLNNVQSIEVVNYVRLPFNDGQVSRLDELSEWELGMANGSYGEKVYGTRKANTSILRMPGVIHGFDYVDAHNELVRLYRQSVVAHRPFKELTFLKMAEDYDLVVSTIPRSCVVPAWIDNPFSIVYVAQVPPNGFVPDSGMADNFVIYNCDPEDPWVRTNRMIHKGQEYWTTEWNKMPPYHVSDLRQTRKVMKCEDFPLPSNIMLAGRYGKWEPGVLASDAYWDVVRRLRQEA